MVEGAPLMYNKLIGKDLKVAYPRRGSSSFLGSSGFEPGPHWWEACALTTAPSLSPGLLREEYTLPCVYFLLDHKVGENSRRKVEQS